MNPSSLWYWLTNTEPTASELDTVSSRLYRIPVGNPPWYVNSTTGSDTNNGQSASKAFKTIAAAVTAASAADTIFLTGSFNEAVTCAKIGMRFIGTGTSRGQTTWTAPTVAGSWCLKLTAANCLVQNIRFRPVIYTTSGTPSAIYLSSAAYTVIRNCRFQGQADSYTAIYSPVANSDNVTIEDCEFIYMNTATYGAAIKGVEADALAYSAWHIKNCTFNSCVTAIDIAGRGCKVEGCTINEVGVVAAGTIGTVLALGIDLSGAGAETGGNVVTGCQLGGTYGATLYKVGNSGDQWYGNYAASASPTSANPA